MPNVLLQTNWPIRVYAYLKDHTEISETFKVIEKDKPEDYIYTPEEVKTWEKLQSEIGDLANLETEVKENLVVAINEAAKSGCESYTLPQATAEALGGVKADSAEATDTQPVRIGGDGKLYTTGEEDFELIFSDTITEDANGFVRTVDKDGNTFELKEAVVIVYTVPFESSTSNVGRDVGFLPSSAWGHNCAASISGSIPAGTSSIARYDVIHVKVVQGYQCLIDRWISQNATNARGVMMRNNTAGQVPINFKFGDDVTAIGELSNAQGNLTCVKIVSYGTCMAKGDVVILYGKRV